MDTSANTNGNERLTQAQLGAELGKSESWCERKRWDGSGPAFIKVGRSVFYLRRDVEAWLESRRHVSTRDKAV